MALKTRANFVEICFLQLLLFNSCRLNAAAMTYDTCKSAPNSYQVGGWCFYALSNSSLTSTTVDLDTAQTLCQPYGNLAVGVTYKALQTFATRFVGASAVYGWTTLVRNSSYAALPPTQGWYWNPRLSNGVYTTLPAVMSNIPWAQNSPPDPNNNGGTEFVAVIQNSPPGLADAIPTLSVYGIFPVAAICQFAPRQWNYIQRGHGRFASSAFLIVQTTCPRHKCIVQCHRSPGCVSLAFNPTNNNCQTYVVSPEDPRFSANVTSDTNYEWHIRDGMEY